MISRSGFKEWRRQRASKLAGPGNGQPLKRFRWWQGLFGRVLFHLELAGTDGRQHVYAVDVWRFSEEVTAHLYLDGRHHAWSETPAAFPVEGGVIEVVVRVTVLKRCHYLADDGTERQLTPDPKSAGGRRVRFDRAHPALARVVGFTSVLVLLIGLGLNLLQAIEPISQIPPLAHNFGTFESPIHLALWLNLALAFVAGVAARERALRLRHNPLLD